MVAGEQHKDTVATNTWASRGGHPQSASGTNLPHLGEISSPESSEGSCRLQSVRGFSVVQLLKCAFDSIITHESCWVGQVLCFVQGLPSHCNCCCNFSLCAD
jgi:hypothetical protein